MKEPKTVHEILLQDGSYTTKLAVACDTNASNIIPIIKREKTTSKYWPEIEKLALETDPEAFKKRMTFIENKRSKTQSKAAA